MIMREEARLIKRNGVLTAYIFCFHLINKKKTDSTNKHNKTKRIYLFIRLPRKVKCDTRSRKGLSRDVYVAPDIVESPLPTFAFWHATDRRD